MKHLEIIKQLRELGAESVEFTEQGIAKVTFFPQDDVQLPISGDEIEREVLQDLDGVAKKQELQRQNEELWYHSSS